jgi:hypothetical protein
MVKKMLALFGLLTTIGSMMFLLLPATGASQASGKLVKNTSITTPVAPPIQIKETKVSGYNIKVGERFDAPDDWLDDLTVIVENTSGKNIEHMQLEFIFPGTVPGGPPLRIPLSYGKVLGLDQLAGFSGPPINPGGAITLTLAPKAGVIRGMLTGRNFRRDAVNIRLARVIFDDGTGWAHGRNTRRDANNPLRWNVLDEAASATSLPLYSRDNVSFTRVSFSSSMAGKAARGHCYRWRSYDIIPCNSCGDITSSDNFDICHADSTNCNYKPKNAVDACGYGEYCFHEQYRLETWLCDTFDEE